MSNSSLLTGLLPHPHGNITLIADPETFCTTTTCDLTLAHIDYIPSLAGNTIFAAMFTGCFLVQLLFGIKYRTWGFMAASTIGMVTETIGYIGRIMMHNNPFSKDNFLIYLVTLTIAPAFLSAAIYLCLARIVVVYGEERSRIRPRTYTILFCSCDFLALLLQAVGGAIASIANTASTTQVGINIMIAGLVCQVASLVLFALCCIDFAFRVYCFSRTPGHPYSNEAPPLPPRPTSNSPSPSSVRSGAPLSKSLSRTSLFRAFLLGLCIATLTVFIRSCFRVAELSGGFHGSLANNEVSFMILEGGMVAIACLTLTIFHPGVCFQGDWIAANFKLGKQKTGLDSVELGKKISRSDSVSDEELDVRDPPQYNESFVDDGASIRSGTAIVIRTTAVRPGQVHVEMSPIYGIRYESTRDDLPRPSI